MKKHLLPAVAAGVVAIAAILTPALAASAAPTHTASKSYTLSVTGNGKHASVVWTTLSTKKETDPYGKPVVPTPVVHTVLKAHEPWTKHVASNFGLYEIAAVQTTGTTLHCTIKNTHGTVIASSYSKGKNTIVTCIAAKDALLAGGTGTGSTTGGTSAMGSSISSSLMSALR